MADMTLEEALAAATVDDTSEDRVLVIDSDLRTIEIPGTVKNLGVESDDDVHRLYFQMPKIYGEFDLSEFDIRINYKNGNIGDVYAVEDKNADGDVITFSWLVGRNAVRTKGTTQFIVCLKKSDSSGVVQQEFNTTVASLNVLEGLETTEQVVQENTDIIEQILKKIDGLTSISPEDIANAVAEYMQANPIDVPKNLSDLQEDATHRTVTDTEKEQWNKSEENVQSDWNETDDTRDSYINNKPESLKNPQKLTFAGAVTAEYDGSGAVTVTIPEGSGGTGLSTEAIDKLEEVGNYLVYTTADGGSKWKELIAILRQGSSGGGSGGTEVTLSSISATYTGGDVPVGTSVTSLTGITVTATYSDGSTTEVTDYMLSGTIAEGSNTITVSYEGKTTTFTVVGYVEEAETTEPVYRLAEATTFDGTNTVDTGYALCENYKAFTVVVDFTSTTKSGSVFGCDKDASYGVGVKCKSVYYWSAYWSENMNKDVYDASNGVKYVITHEVNSNIAKAYYIYKDALTTQEFTISEGNYNNSMNFTNTVILGNGFTGIINDFKIYESVLNQEEINAYVGV